MFYIFNVIYIKRINPNIYLIDSEIKLRPVNTYIAIHPHYDVRYRFIAEALITVPCMTFQTAGLQILNMAILLRPECRKHTL